MFWLGIVFILVLVFFLGPRPRVHYQPKAIHLPNDLDLYLHEQESKHNPLENTEKKIIWAHQDKRKTELCIVYLHGYSATRQESHPLCENLASSLSANLYLSRLEGHGLGVEGFKNARAQGWMDDALESMEIAKRLGNKIIIVAVSTGATLSTWISSLGCYPISCLVFLSPNFQLKNKMNKFTSGPWGSALIKTFMGPYRYSDPSAKNQSPYWTYKQSTKVVVELMKLMNFFKNLNLNSINVPLFIACNPQDKVISYEKALEVYENWSHAKKDFFSLPSPHHIIAGNIVAPQNMAVLEDKILNFIKNVTE